VSAVKLNTAGNKVAVTFSAGYLLIMVLNTADGSTDSIYSNTAENSVSIEPNGLLFDTNIYLAMQGSSSSW
jgi:hypothetical protein